MSDTTPVELLPEVPHVFEITFSPTIGKIVEALAKAQLKFKPVIKQNENAAFTRGNRVSYYADLATYIDATQEALASEGLVIMQWPDVSPEAKSMSLISILAHSSGEWMKGKTTLPATGRDGFTPQSCGSSITYARRYSYAAITGCASEDDDGNAASGRGSAKDAQDVAKGKLEQWAKEGNKTAQAALESQEKPPDETASLFYVWSDASQSAQIIGHKGLMKLNEDLLRPLKVGKELVANADQLEYLKLRLEERNTPFRPLKTA